MDVLQAIRDRRSVGKVKQDPVDHKLIQQILEAGTWAPNHHRTEPWKFFVLTGDGRKPLGKVLAEITEGQMDDPMMETNQLKLKKQQEKTLRAPVIIAVAVTPSTKEKVIEIEEIGAVNAAIQNMLLAAHALGLGAIWRTGQACYDQKVKQLFKLNERDKMLGFIYIGYPDMPPRKGKRTHFEQKTEWIDYE